MLCGLRGGLSRGILVPLGLQLNTVVINYGPVTGQKSSIRPRPLTLVQTSTPTTSTVAASQLPHTSDVVLNVSTETSVLSLDACTQTSQPSPTLLRDASTQAAPHSAAFTGASTQLPLTEFFLGCVYSQDPLDRAVPLPILGNVSGASLPQPKDIGTVNSFSSASGNSGQIPVPRTQLDSTPPPPPGLEGQALLGTSHIIPSKAAPVRPHSHHGPSFTSPSTLTPPTSPPTPQPQVSTTQVGTHTTCSTVAHKRSASTALAEIHSAIGADSRAGRGPFPKPRPAVLPMVRFGLPKLAGHGYLHNADSDLMHHQYRLSVLQRNPGPARRNPTQIIETCGRVHAVILQEASDHVTHVTDQVIAYTGNTNLAILLNRDTFEPNHAVLAFQEASSSKDTWCMVVLVVRGLLRRPSLCGSPTVTFCSVHIHNVEAKKRDASTDLAAQRRLQWE